MEGGRTLKHVPGPAFNTLIPVYSTKGLHRDAKIGLIREIVTGVDCVAPRLEHVVRPAILIMSP